MGVGFCFCLLKFFLLLRFVHSTGQNVTIYGPVIAKSVFQDLSTSFMLTHSETVEYVVAQDDTNSYISLDQPCVVDTLDNVPNTSLTIPIFGFPLVIVYNLGSSALLLTQRALVDIFLGRITRWNDGNLTTLNPNITLPDQPIILVVGLLLDRFAEGMSVLAGESVNVASLLSLNSTINAGPNVCAKVEATPYSIGLSWMADAVKTGVRLALLQNKAGFFASPAQGAPIALSEYHATQKAALPNENKSPHNMLGRLAWPLMEILYIILPPQFTSCSRLHTLQDFLALALFRTTAMDQMVQLGGWQPAKSLSLLDQSLGIIEQNVNYRDLLFGIPCGDASQQQQKLLFHTVGASSLLWSNMLKMLAPYTGDIDPSLELSPSKDITFLLDEMVRGGNASLDVDMVLTYEHVMASYPQLFSVPAFMTSVVPFVNIGPTSPVLSIPILADIFTGVITQWNDSRIGALNPNLVLPTQPINVLAAPILSIDGRSSFFSRVLREYSPNFSWSQVNKTVASGSTDIAERMRFTPFSIGYGLGIEDPVIRVPKLVGLNNQIVSFSAESLSACWISQNHPNCWPLAKRLFMALRHPGQGVSCEHQKHSVDFVAWILKRTEGLHQYLVPNLDAKENLGEAEYCAGRSLLFTRPEPQTPDASLKYAIHVLSAIGMLWAACQAIALGVARKQSALKSASVLFSLLAVIGVFFILLAPLLIVQDAPSAANCTSSMWFLTFGFSLCYGSLFAKLFRLYTIFTSRKLVVPRLSNRRLLVIVSAFLVVDFILVLIYSILTPPGPFDFSARSPSAEDLVTGYREFTLNMCSFHANSPVLYLILILKLLVAFSGAGMSFFIRQVDRRFSATSALGWAFYNMFLTAFVAILILVIFASENNLESSLFTPMFCGLWIMFVTLIALTLDSNVLLACKDLSTPLRKLLNGSKDSKEPELRKGSGDPVSITTEPKRSHSSTIFVINRDMFPSAYDDFDGMLLEKILEELNFQRTAVRRALVNTSTTSSASTNDLNGETYRGSSKSDVAGRLSKRKSGLCESPAATKLQGVVLKSSLDLLESQIKIEIEAPEAAAPTPYIFTSLEGTRDSISAYSLTPNTDGNSRNSTSICVDSPAPTLAP
jgi:phosphate transport system substrate-binding protein